ncbi:hypothetical protein ExPCM12_02756 [Escherichia coli]|nr:hypothetical protein ExPCM12_02756 [Escherichia coli]
MLWNQQGTHRFRPLTRIFLRTREPGFAGLLHNAMFRRHAILAINHNTYWLTEILLRVEPLSLFIQFRPTHC